VERRRRRGCDGENRAEASTVPPVLVRGTPQRYTLISMPYRVIQRR
jgi:hypothetical protein